METKHCSRMQPTTPLREETSEQLDGQLNQQFSGQFSEQLSNQLNSELINRLNNQLNEKSLTELDTDESTYVQCNNNNQATSTITTSLLSDLQMDTLSNSFTNHQTSEFIPNSTSLPCSSGNHQSIRNEFEHTDLEFIESSSYPNSFDTQLIPPQATRSLSSNNNNINLLDKLEDNNNPQATTTIHSNASTQPAIETTTSSLNLISELSSELNNQLNSSELHNELNNQLNNQLNSTLPTSKSSDEPLLNKLSNVLDTDDLVPQDCTLIKENLRKELKDDLVVKDNSSKLNVDELRDKLKEQFNNQALFNQQLINDNSMSADSETMDEEDCSEECSSEEEKRSSRLMESSSNLRTNKKRPLVEHSCSKKRRKQNNPSQCNNSNQATQYDYDEPIDQLNQLHQHLKQQLNETSIEERSELLNNIKNIEYLQQNLQSQLINRTAIRKATIKQQQQQQPQSQQNEQHDEQEEEGQIRKFPNTLSGAANAAARFFLSNHQTGTSSTTIKNDQCESAKLNYTYYLAAAAAAATRASLKGTKHCLNYCKECCCPFLSTEHEKLYRELEKQREVNSQYDKSSVFAQQIQNLVQQSKLMQDIETVFGSTLEMGQLPQRNTNALDAMQLIKQLESGHLDNEEAKVYQQQLVSLLNSNMFNVSNNQMANPLSTLLANRIFNPDAYCVLCKKEFCNKYFLKTHIANKHAGQDHLMTTSDSDKCISPMNSGIQMIGDEFAGGDSSLNQITNPEAYCFTCKRGFCNKYFLKTHKQKVHSNNNTAECSTVNHTKSPVSLSPKRSGDQTTTAQLQYELMNAINNSEQQANEDAALVNSNSNNNTNNSTSVATLTNEQKQQKDAIRNQLSLQLLSNANQLQQLSAVMQAESFANILRNSIVQPNSSEISTADLGQLLSSTNTNFFFTPEKLREMGVMNPEAFCEICLKEFCNKYFLKTHKANKHNIHIEDDCGSSSCDSQTNHHTDQNDKSNSKNEMCNQDDTMEPGQCPSNLNPVDLTTLIMINNLKQQQLNSQAANNKASTQQPNKEESKEGLLSCELCSKYFPTNYQLKMHRYYSHKIPFAKDNSDEDDVRVQEKSEQIDRNNNSNTNEEATNLPKELNNEAGLDLTQQPQQSLLEQQQNEDLLKFQQMIKELEQQHSENDLEAEFLKKILLHKQQQLANASKINEETPIYCDCCEIEFKNRSAFRSHNCPNNENNRLADSPNSMFSNLSAQMANTMLNNSNNSTLNYALNGDTESLVNQAGNTTGNLNLSSNGRDTINNPLLNNLSSNSSNHTNPNRLSPGDSLSQNNPLLANLTQGLPQNLPTDVTNSIFFSSTAGITLDQNSKQPKFVAGRNYCNLCNKELCNKYFMKTHMMKMHSINIDEHPAEARANSIVGGVMCDICQKELCSKYFLKVHKQNTHGIYEDGGIPVTNPQQLMTTNSTSSNVQNPLVNTQSNLSPNTCSISANGLVNQSAANTLNPLLSSVYEAGLSKEQQAQLQQLQLEINKQSQQMILNQVIKNGNAAANFLEQQSSTPVPFNNSSLAQQNPPSNGSNSMQHTAQSNERSEKELFYMQGIDPSDTTNRYFNQYTEVCPYCKRRFKSIKWMKSHLFNEHQHLINNNAQSPLPPTNKMNNSKQQSNETSDKIRCIFCTKLFFDNITLHLHLVNDHRILLEEMVLTRNMENSNFAALNQQHA